jgi:hypothetical protein
MLAAAMAIAADPAVAQTHCASSRDADRARCELEKRADEACAGRTGEDLAACRKSILSPPAREDCSRLPEGYGRNKCEDRNLKLDVEERCGAKPGDEYSRCYAEVMAKALKR